MLRIYLLLSLYIQYIPINIHIINVINSIYVYIYIYYSVSNA